jgi:hypothetical protein
MTHPHQTFMLLCMEYNQTPIKLNDLTATTRPEDITAVSREGEAEVELGSVELGRRRQGLVPWVPWEL